MKNTRDNGLSDRRQASIEAKKAQLENFRTAQKAAEPSQAIRQAERLAMAEAREARRAAQAEAKRAEQARRQQEEALRLETAAADAEAAEAARIQAEADQAARLIEEEAARKAERDRRYASRKARQS
nr:DUF6481 family protein [uncultured Gellertiella sp.]